VLNLIPCCVSPDPLLRFDGDDDLDLSAGVPPGDVLRLTCHGYSAAVLNDPYSAVTAIFARGVLAKG